MAKVHTLPPQAYTRDVLVKAIDWVATQSPAMRERASSADALVSLYLQARRRTSEWQNEAPVSGENFRNDLKHLAEDLKQFEQPSAPPQVPHVPVYEPPPPTYTPPPMPAPPPPPKAPPSTPGWIIDPRSLSAAKEIQSRLNLGSEVEALRLIVTLGLERARQMFP
jgi:hypothetical protein